MGYLMYGNGPRIIIDDRLLRHVMVVCAVKLRHHETFLLEVVHSPREGAGRDAIWIAPSAPILFHYNPATHDTLDTTLLDTLHKQADHGHLRITPRQGVIE
jgi:hypothetical protein